MTTLQDIIAAAPAGGGRTPHELLRFATAGSVDDGKSTLVGRLLHDTKSVLADTLAAVHRASIAKGHEVADLALLTDGLRAEREQGITIDVAYRYFATANRSFVLADTPGHVEYTRNMVTGASTAELALVLVDARHGVVEQTRRHAAVAALLGVRHVALAVNKMDLVGFDEGVFTSTRDEFVGLLRTLGVDDVVAIPLSALRGDNVVERSAETPWYDGPTLLEHLESVPVGDDPALEAFRFPVQYVIRPQTDEHHDHRAYAGKVAHGVVRVGDEVVVHPSGRTTTVAAIDGLDGPLDVAFAPQSVSLRLTDDLDVSRGDLVAAADGSAAASQDLEGDVCVLSQRPIAAGDRVLLRHGTRTVRARVQQVHDRLDLDTLQRAEHLDALALNDIGRISVRLAEPVATDPYSELRRTGAFLLVDEQDGSTLAAGMAITRCRED
ncbi:MAG TPA: GTP-binding protein [Candidatus Nanopelagicales bacterium]|nr:GTP-binding protein [Candidatus Nanopelagicales bacterium]